mgnify:CR=1 FL=1
MLLLRHRIFSALGTVRDFMLSPDHGHIAPEVVDARPLFRQHFDTTGGLFSAPLTQQGGFQLQSFTV